MEAETEKRVPKEVSPVSFYQDRPFGVAGNMVKKDFSTKIETTPEDSDEPGDAPDGDVTGADAGGSDHTEESLTDDSAASTGEDDTNDEGSDATTGDTGTDTDNETLEI